MSSSNIASGDYEPGIILRAMDRIDAKPSILLVSSQDAGLVVATAPEEASISSLKSHKTLQGEMSLIERRITDLFSNHSFTTPGGEKRSKAVATDIEELIRAKRMGANVFSIIPEVHGLRDLVCRYAAAYDAMCSVGNQQEASGRLCNLGYACANAVDQRRGAESSAIEPPHTDTPSWLQKFFSRWSDHP